MRPNRTYGGLTDVNQLLAEVLKFKGETVSQSYQKYTPTTIDPGLQQRYFTQAARLKASLEGQIAQLQSLANIGESRLNKWRSRIFS